MSNETPTVADPATTENPDTAHPGSAADLPIPQDGTPEWTRRMTALLEAHRTGVLTYLASVVDSDGSRAHVVIFKGHPYRLAPEEVLPMVWLMASVTDPRLADARFAYRLGLRAPVADPN